MQTSPQEPQPTTTAYVPRHLASPVAAVRAADLPADPRGMRWDRSPGVLSRVLDELSVLDEGGVSLARR
ncbi:hypothetical protein H9623_17630 [Oerskovia sp. Sa1BUA8]|uniref:Uncharacterized protein n=1 Tax=Oerskovia douganii TaxID=2762210 RepID=A0A9D5Z0E3_9CELL|nr:hypothetical protein [Oerskovia douganii]MBE7702115.1 hypothetical protein [Oerskovia douganii]